MTAVMTQTRLRHRPTVPAGVFLCLATRHSHVLRLGTAGALPGALLPGALCRGHSNTASEVILLSCGLVVRSPGRTSRPGVTGPAGAAQVPSFLSLLRSLTRRPRSAPLSWGRAGGGQGPWRAPPERGPCPRRIAPGCRTPVPSDGGLRPGPPATSHAGRLRALAPGLLRP